MQVSDWISVKDRLPDITHNESLYENCAFDKNGYGKYCKHLCCSHSSRHDNQSVIFVRKI